MTDPELARSARIGIIAPEMLKYLLLPLIAVALNSCGTRVHVNVTRFHKLPPKGAGEKFVVSAPDEPSGLEKEQHLSQLAAGLVKHGWVQSHGNYKSADYQVAIKYGRFGGARKVHGVRPIWGQTSGGTTANISGNVHGYGSYGGYNGTYSGTATTSPTYGVVGSVPTVDTVYDRYLLLMIFDKNDRTVMETKCLSSGSNSNVSIIAPKMIEAALKSFPGKSGESYDYWTRLR